MDSRRPRGTSGGVDRRRGAARDILAISGTASRGISSASGEGSRLDVDSEVLLVFEDGDDTRPVIVGFLEPRARKGQTLTSALLRRDKNGNVRVNGKIVELRGEESMVLICGKSSITMFADGRVIVKGTRLVSRASESNKIKGGTIALN